MKKIKLFLCVALFGAMSFGAFSAYQSMTMSEEERFLLANIEALTNGEPGGGTGKYTCEDTIVTGDGKTFYCGSCNWVENSEEAWNSSTKTCIK